MIRTRRPRVVRVADGALAVAFLLWLASLLFWYVDVFSPLGRRILLVRLSSGWLDIQLETPFQPDPMWQLPVRGRPSVLSRMASFYQQDWGINSEFFLLTPLARCWGWPTCNYSERASIGIPSTGGGTGLPANVGIVHVAVPSWCGAAVCAFVCGAVRVGGRRRVDPARCRRCGYDLRGLNTGCCPECGTAFVGEPADRVIISA